MAETIGFIGLGLMGEPMAANLLKAGFALRVWNRSPQKAAQLVAQGAVLCGSPAEVATPGGIVVTMVADDAVLDDVAFGERGFAPVLGEGGLHVSMSTVSPESTRRLAQRHRALGSRLLAAPVFGRPTAAAAAKLWICQSGPADAAQRAKPLLAAMSQGVQDFGADEGAANVAKLAGNFMIGAALEAMGEAYALAEKNGVDRKTLSDFLSGTIFAAPVYVSYSAIVAAKQADWVGFPLQLGLKDFNLVLDAAGRSKVPMPLANLVRDRLLSAVARGRGEHDWTALTHGAAEDAGLAVGKGGG
jgi:3-hydroxyisobutyrate dehydrogenase-like beta-hydroxyacid dehydrogenase